MTTLQRPGRLSGALHDCAAPACGSQVPAEFLMCKRHWSAVPERLRMEVWYAYRNYQRHRSLETHKAYQEARRKAIKSLTQETAPA